MPLKLRAADEPKFQLFDDKGNPIPRKLITALDRSWILLITSIVADFLEIYGQEKAVSFEQAPGGALFGRVNTDEHI